MTPVFFPFTYMSETTAAALSAVFSKTALYRPSGAPLPETLQRQADAGFLEIRTPVGGDEDRLMRAADDYQAWAERRGGSPLAFLKARTGRIPFFEESSLSRIRSDIKRWAEDRVDGESPDPIFAARLFLSVAQAFDQQQTEVDRSFAGLRDLESSLLKSIHGEADADAPAMGAATEDLGRHMTKSRLWAWSSLWAVDPAAPHLLVTDSREVFETTLDPLFDADQVDRFNIACPPASSGPEWQEKWDRFLGDLLTAETDALSAPSPSEQEGRRGRRVLRLFRVRGMGPLDVVTKAADRAAPPETEIPDKDRPAATVVGFLDFSV